MAHYLATRMIKLKSQNLGGIQKHNQREFENHSNKDIDQTRSYLNYDLLNEQNINYREKIMKTIEDQKTSDRKIRKDAVLTNEFFVTSSKEFFDELDPDEQKRFFETSAEWFQERYGKQNIAYATVHNDETTPHMHVGVVPMRDGKLQGKNVFNRAELLHIQENLPKYLEDKGFDVKRGEDRSKNYHVQPEDWKQQQEVARKETLELRKEKENMASEVSNLTSKAVSLEKEVEGLEIDKKALEAKKRAIRDELRTEPTKIQLEMAYKFFQDGSYARDETKVTIPITDFHKLDNVYRNGTKIIKENERLELENDDLREENSFLKMIQEQLKTTLKIARDRLSEMLEGAGIEQSRTNFFNQAMSFAHRMNKGKARAGDSQIEKNIEDMFDDPNGMYDFEMYKLSEKRKELKENKIVQKHKISEEPKNSEEMEQIQFYRGRDDFEM